MQYENQYVKALSLFKQHSTHLAGNEKKDIIGLGVSKQTKGKKHKKRKWLITQTKENKMSIKQKKNMEVGVRYLVLCGFGLFCLCILYLRKSTK